MILTTINIVQLRNNAYKFQSFALASKAQAVVGHQAYLSDQVTEIIRVTFTFKLLICSG